jgi:putative ATPase
MKDLGYGKGYKYPHNHGGHIEQSYLPEELQGKEYYKPTENGFDKEIKNGWHLTRQNKRRLNRYDLNLSILLL